MGLCVRSNCMSVSIPRPLNWTTLHQERLYILIFVMPKMSSTISYKCLLLVLFVAVVFVSAEWCTVQTTWVFNKKRTQVCPILWIMSFFINSREERTRTVEFSVVVEKVKNTRWCKLFGRPNCRYLATEKRFRPEVSPLS